MSAVIKRSFLHGLSLVLQRISLNWMRLGLMGIDAVIFNACLILALWLRFDGAIPADYWAVYYRHALWFTALFLLVSFRLGLYNRIWKYASADAALVIALSVSVTVVLGVAICMFLGGDQFPRGVLAMLWGFTLLFVGVSRFGWRAARSSFGKTNGYTNGERRRLLIYGAGESGVLLAREARQDPHSMYDVVGFMDDSRKLKGMVVSGFRVLGTSQDFETIAQKYEVQEVIVAQKSVGVAQLSDVVEAGKTLGVKVRRVPSLLEMVDGEAGLPRVRDIEVSDLIGRNPVCPTSTSKRTTSTGAPFSSPAPVAPSAARSADSSAAISRAVWSSWGGARTVSIVSTMSCGRNSPASSSIPSSATSRSPMRSRTLLPAIVPRSSSMRPLTSTSS